MGFVNPTRDRVTLKDWQDEPIALRFLSEETDIPVNLPTGPDMRDATLAEFAARTPEGEIVHGETLVFYQVVRNQLHSHPKDWVLGKLNRVDAGKVAPDGTDQTYFVLEDLDSIEFQVMERHLTEAGLG